MNNIGKKKFKKIILVSLAVVALGSFNFCFASVKTLAKSKNEIASASYSNPNFFAVKYASEEKCEEENTNYINNEINYTNNKTAVEQTNEFENTENQIGESGNSGNHNHVPILSCCPDHYLITRIDTSKNKDYSDLIAFASENDAVSGEQQFFQDSSFDPSPHLPSPEAKKLASVFKRE